MLSFCLLATTYSQAYRNTHTLRPPAEQIDIATYTQTVTHNTRTDTHTHTYIHTHTHIHIFTHTHTHTHAHAHTHTHTVKHTRPKGNRSARRPAAMRGFSGCGC
jgi:hypothetical protein